MDHEEFMRHVVELSRVKMLERQGGPFAAAVVMDGEIVGEGWNCVTGSNDPTAHAEIQAVRAACAARGTFTLEGAAIYASCEPCPMCLAAIYWARIDTVYYANTTEDAAAIGFDDGFLYDELSKPSRERKVTLLRVDVPEAKEVFAQWEQMPDKIRY